MIPNCPRWRGLSAEPTGVVIVNHPPVSLRSTAPASGGMSISILKRMTVKSNTDLRPWSHRQNVLVKVSITIAAGVASAFVGTFAHRMGAELNIPYGLVLAFLIIGLSTWCARSRMGVVGLALHLIASSLTVWGMALTTTSGKALIVAAYHRAQSAPALRWYRIAP